MEIKIDVFEFEVATADVLNHKPDSCVCPRWLNTHVPFRASCSHSEFGHFVTIQGNEEVKNIESGFCLFFSSFFYCCLDTRKPHQRNLVICMTLEAAPLISLL